MRDKASVWLGLVFFTYGIFAVTPAGRPDEARKRDIKKGWARLAGQHRGKVVYARPPKMIILDLKSGVSREIPGVTVAGDKGIKKRGKSPRPYFSPDGNRFIYRYAGHVYVCDAKGTQQKIDNPLMDGGDETTWSWYRENGKDWAVGPSINGNMIMVDMADPRKTRLVYGGGNVHLHGELTGTGEYVVFADKGSVFVAPVGTLSKDGARKISIGQGCRPCAAPDNRVAWLPEPHKRYWICDAATGECRGELPGPPPEEIYRLNWSNRPDFAVHMAGSDRPGNDRIHVRRLSTGESLFIGNGWDPDLWVQPD